MVAAGVDNSTGVKGDVGPADAMGADDDGNCYSGGDCEGMFCYVVLWYCVDVEDK
jgi:hypothetical protein